MIDDILYEINKLSVRDGYNKTKIPYLTIYKSNKNIIYMPKLKNAYIYFALD
ncbi:MAG: hypothetical protein K2N11_01445 [Mucispirillum sp.]|nr:hypothetical protein [Mucispirillum sp.]